MTAGLTIGKAARRAGVGVETIRFYERQQLIEQPPKPFGAGARTYPDETVRRIRFVKEAQELGFSLRETRELMTLRMDPAADCSDVRALAAAKLADVRRKIGRLQDIGTALERLIGTCPGGGGLDACSIMDALSSCAQAHSAILDEPSSQRLHERTASMKSTAFTIEGMRCNACADKVKRLLEREPGVKGVSVSLADRQARVLYEPQSTNESALAAAIEKPGYRVVERR